MVYTSCDIYNKIILEEIRLIDTCGEPHTNIQEVNKTISHTKITILRVIY